MKIVSNCTSGSSKTFTLADDDLAVYWWQRANRRNWRRSPTTQCADHLGESQQDHEAGNETKKENKHEYSPHQGSQHFFFKLWSVQNDFGKVILMQPILKFSISLNHFESPLSHFIPDLNRIIWKHILDLPLISHSSFKILSHKCLSFKSKFVWFWLHK